MHQRPVNQVMNSVIGEGLSVGVIIDPTLADDLGGVRKWRNRRVL